MHVWVITEPGDDGRDRTSRGTVAAGLEIAGQLGCSSTVIESDASPDALARSFVEEGLGDDPCVVVASTSDHGSETGARLAWALDGTLVGDVVAWHLRGPSAIVFRPVSDNRRSERIELTASHLVLTIPPDTVDPDTDSVVDPPVLRLGGTSRFAPEVVDRQPEDMRNLPLRHADIVVAGGRGVGGPEGFRHIELLADALNGTVAASRVATDLGWIDRDRLVGQTGETVIPRLYVACGISGQSQHLIGMKDSETIVAINQDPSAPIVAMADIAAIGDLAEVIPAAVAELVDPS